MAEWLDISTLPPPGKRPGKIWVIVEGSEFHSGAKWLRAAPGIARTKNDGFYQEDIDAIAAADSMDRRTARVTHWMQIDLPPLPQFATT